MNKDEDVFSSKIYVDEDGVVSTQSYMNDLLRYQAEDDESIQEDLKVESPEEYWDDVIEYAKRGAAVGFDRYDDINDYAINSISKQIKSCLHAKDIQVEEHSKGCWKATFTDGEDSLEDINNELDFGGESPLVYAESYDDSDVFTVFYDLEESNIEKHWS